MIAFVELVVVVEVAFEETVEAASAELVEYSTSCCPVEHSLKRVISMYNYN